MENTSSIVRELLTDAIKGDSFPLCQLLNFLHVEQKYSADRLQKFGERSLHLTEHQALGILIFCGVITIH